MPAISVAAVDLQLADQHAWRPRPLYARGARLLGFEPHQLHSQHHPSRIPGLNFKASSGFVPTHHRHMIVFQQQDYKRSRKTLTVPGSVMINSKTVRVPFCKAVLPPIWGNGATNSGTIPYMFIHDCFELSAILDAASLCTAFNSLKSLIVVHNRFYSTLVGVHA